MHLLFQFLRIIDLAGMSRYRWILALLAIFYSSLSICTASIVRPISDSHRSAALELFVPVDESFGSLENTYEALRTLEILGLEKTYDISRATCKAVLETLGSSPSTTKDLFYALKVNGILKCQIEAINFEGIASNMLAVLKNANSLPDFYYSIGSLLLIKKHGFKVILPDSDGAFHSIKALSQSDGRWRYDSNGAESSTYAAGMALEALAGIVFLADSEVDQSMIGVVKNDIVKLFDIIKSYNDGTLYFNDKYVHSSDYKSPLEISAAVVRGVTSFAEVSSGKLNIPGNKILGLAKFFLSIGVPGSSKDLFHQIESLSCLENNRIYIPLVISLPGTVLSLTSRDQLKVDVTTVFGAAAPPLSVKLVQAFNSNSEGKPIIENQELHFDKENSIHYLDIASLKMDAGKYKLIFEVSLHNLEDESKYATGGLTSFSAFFTGSIKIDKGELAILNSDGGSAETIEKLDLSKDSFLSLSANHLQKFRLSFQLTTPLGHTFKPHQVFLKLRHETKVEHLFVIDSSARQYKLILDFLGLVEKFYYLSGKYDIELTVGDATMENSFLRTLGFVELDLPEPPEKAAQPPPQPADPYLRYGPKEEIIHIFRAPEKRPPKELSLAFLALTFLPLIGFIIGLIRLGVNLKFFPSSPGPAAFSILFHAGIAAVLLLYGLFWLKLDLFTALKALCFLGPFLVFVGHRTLSHLASTSAKLKSS
ncbi:dolichyl-diphosphooligosaccharide--protein glycosyltransferase subunit 2 [Dendrobium catenatum]|uniref:Dolichyl-diphosphooligosaccharide--protein glycosyltransferase subunit 2 n=1 Tax=Dendrobium catenatum TaxID=906689 RepID=A0A2I0WB26_9ASPA|nr:dolichyl-diphosphooligosaccharide--protein glycosyltransferase subunit 2 [Dendrobium catenatum]PKU72864.1 Dolichyl-diphosphooligosaccharide--protein glycosyltransferase subunit 2 [Dendrobium catenatum]